MGSFNRRRNRATVLVARAGLGILPDTFVVRTLIIPALFARSGDPIWWAAYP